MSALKDGMIEITLDRPRKLLFDLNVIEALDDKYGGYDKLMEILSPEKEIEENGETKTVKNKDYLKDIKFILCLLLNEAAEYQNYLAGEEVEKPITEKILGMIVNASILASGETTGAILSAFNVGTAGKAKAETDDEDPMKAATEKSTT